MNWFLRNKIKPDKFTKQIWICFVCNKTAMRLALKNPEYKSAGIAELAKSYGDSDVAIISGGISIWQIWFLKKKWWERRARCKKELFTKFLKNPVNHFCCLERSKNSSSPYQVMAAALVSCISIYCHRWMQWAANFTGKKAVGWNHFRHFGKGRTFLFSKANIQDDVITQYWMVWIQIIFKVLQERMRWFIYLLIIFRFVKENMDVFTLPVNWRPCLLTNSMLLF